MTVQESWDEMSAGAQAAIIIVPIIFIVFLTVVIIFGVRARRYGYWGRPIIAVGRGPMLPPPVRFRRGNRIVIR